VCAEDQVFSSAEISFIPWMTTTMVAMSADDVRRNPLIRVQIEWETGVKVLIKSLAFDQADPIPGDAGIERDVRLVIDLKTSGGGRRTYYATRFGLYTEDGRPIRRVDDQFRSRFEAFERAISAREEDIRQSK